jgi:hypothetical protein
LKIIGFNQNQDQSGSSLEKLCHWREVFNRGEHLVKNWQRGIYFVVPILKSHKGYVTAFDSNGWIKLGFYL